MKKFKKISLIICTIILVSLTTTSLTLKAKSIAYQGSEYYAYEIDSLKVVMNIQENGEVEVTEVYDVNFKERSQGLRRDLPVNNVFKGTINGKDIDEKFKLPVSDITSNFPVEVDHENKFTVIKMVDRDKYIDGMNTFELSYTIDTKDLNRLNYSMFYWDLVSNTFDTTINHAEFTVNFPKAFDQNQVFVYSGDYKLESNDEVDVTTSLNSVHLVSKDVIYPDQSVTLQVNLDEGYFNYPELKPFNWLLMGGALLSIVISLFAFFLAGKKEEVVTISSFSAPDGMTSGLVGKFMGIQNYLSVPAMFVEWANKGLLAFYEVVDEKKPKKKPKMFVEVLSSDTSQLIPYEKLLFDQYFSTVKPDDNNKRMVSLEKLGKKKVFEAYNSARSSIAMTLKQKDLQLFTTRSIAAAVLLVLNVIHVLALITLFKSIYYFIPISSYILIFVVGIINLILSALIVGSRSIQYEKPKLSITLFGIGAIIQLVVMCIISYFLLANKISILVVGLYAIATLILFVCSYQVLRTSKESALVLGQLLGFKEYISMVEMDSLKVNIEDQPNLFFNVLPYAFIFGLTELWIEKFKLLDNIQPNWYHASSGTNFSYWYWYSMYDRSTRSAVKQSSYRFDPSISVGSGSSGGSFGGGSGGGGFSGGGFGGGGGGRI